MRPAGVGGERCGGFGGEDSCRAARRSEFVYSRGMAAVRTPGSRARWGELVRAQ